MGRATYDDILLYQRCPYLYTRFNQPQPTNNRFTQLDQVYIDTVYRIFTREAELGYMPSSSTSTMYFNKYLGQHKDEFTTSTILSHIQKLNKLFTLYQDTFYNQGSRVVAVKFDSFIRLDSMFYTETIPVIQMSSNSTLSMIFIEPNSISPARDNRFRFAATMLSQIFDMPVQNYYVLYIKNQTIHELTYRHYTINNTELNNARQELNNILKQMQNNIQTPNTSICSSCQFLRECNL